MDVLLAVEVDPQVGERPAQGRQHQVAREALVPLRRADHALDVPPLRLVEADPEQVAERAVDGLLVQRLRRLEERAALSREVVQLQAEPLVELEVRRRAERRQRCARLLDGLEVERVQVLLGRLPHHAIDPLALGAVGLVGHRRAQHPERNRLAVDRDLELGLERSELLGVGARQPPEVALAGEAPELADAAVAVDRRAERLRLLELGQVGVPLVDRLELEPLLQAAVVEVELLVELGDEPVRAGPEGVELLRCRRARHSP